MFKFLTFLSLALAALAMTDVAATAGAAPAPTYDQTALASIKSGKHDCPNCVLTGADLTNTCVKSGNVQGAKFDNAKLVLMCMSYANFTGASFRGADMAGANLAHAIVDGADFTGATLSITSIKGTDMRRALGLTQAQLDKACGDADTKVPTGMKVHTCS
ncbi:MAG TPA: pentapeptide repeat-containing protein [Rhizomicrobium sp.]|jgi:uncharacterized protein YjbI with pentapeptide repeats|nr:pentapeptide repeat-containing protein [Rhizomicrobium sp.]